MKMIKVSNLQNQFYVIVKLFDCLIVIPLSLKV